MHLHAHSWLFNYLVRICSKSWNHYIKPLQGCLSVTKVNPLGVTNESSQCLIHSRSSINVVKLRRAAWILFFLHAHTHKEARRVHKEYSLLYLLNVSFKMLFMHCLLYYPPNLPWCLQVSLLDPPLFLWCLVCISILVHIILNILYNYIVCDY